MLPFMTKDFIKMKQKERALSKSCGTKVFLTFYIWAMWIFNMGSKPAITHLKARGIFTCYWVINEQHEAYYALSMTECDSIMTDRPTNILSVIKKAPEGPITVNPFGKKND